MTIVCCGPMLKADGEDASVQERAQTDDDLTALTCEDEMVGHDRDRLCLLVLYKCSLFWIDL